MRASHFDTWFVKLVAVVSITAALAWMAYAVKEHYRLQHACNCVLGWEYLPFVVCGIGIAFFATILSRKATSAAVAVVLPILDKLRPGKSTTSTTIVPAQPAQPAKVVTTTTVPLPLPPKTKVAPVTTDVTGTEFDEEEGK